MKKSVFLLFLLAAMLLHPGDTTEGARYGLSLWYSSVVPALFPFMVLSALIVSSGGLSRLMKPFYALFHPLFGLSEAGCYVLLSGFVCGFPMGAKNCADFLREGRIGRQEANILLAVSNHPSPMFLLGYAYPFFSEQISAAHFLLSIYGPVLLLFLLAKAVYGCPRKQSIQNQAAERGGRIRETPSSQTHSSVRETSVEEAILSAVEILCKIGGCLVFFSILIVHIRRISLLPMQTKAIMTAFLEMTTGVKEAAALPYPLSAAVSVAALSFGGLSGLFQTGAVLGDMKKNPGIQDSSSGGLSVRSYFLWKLLHGVMAAFSLLLPLLFR